MKIKIGSRGSNLAVTQTKWVGEALLKKSPDLEIEYVQIKTTGDRDQNSALNDIGGKGVFVKELESALLKKEIDVAVHSLKDVPQLLPAGLDITSYPRREDVRDAFISRFGELIHELPKGSILGTGSPRRAAQIKAKYKDRYRIETIRGNVETRLKKVSDGEFDGIIVALAGLKRLGLEGEATQVLESSFMMPAPCQGCLGLEHRDNDPAMVQLLGMIRDQNSTLTAQAERAFLQGLGGSCLLPVAGLAEIQDKNISIRGIVYDPDTGHSVEGSLTGPSELAAYLGAQLAEKLLYDGASEILVKF